MRDAHNCGFTLLELMVGAVVLIIALVGLIAAYVGCYKLNENARNLTIAANDGQAVMEEMRDRNVTFNITQEDWTDWAAQEPPVGGGCNTLDNENIVVTYPSGAAASPLEILVTVNWTDKGTQRSTQLTTLLTER